MTLKNRASISSQSDARGAVSLVEATRANVHFAKEAHTFVAVSDTIKMIAKSCISDTSILIGTGVASNVAIATSTHMNALFDSIVLLERRAASWKESRFQSLFKLLNTHCASFIFKQYVS